MNNAIATVATPNTMRMVSPLEILSCALSIACVICGATSTSCATPIPAVIVAPADSLVTGMGAAPQYRFPVKSDGWREQRIPRSRPDVRSVWGVRFRFSWVDHDWKTELFQATLCGLFPPSPSPSGRGN